MKLPRFKPLYCNGRAHAWAVGIPPYLSPTGKTQRRFFLTLARAKAFGDHMRRRWEDHEHDSTYLTRDKLAEASRAYRLIEDLSAELTPPIGGVKSDMSESRYTLLSIVQDWASRERAASISVTLESLIDQYIAARSGASKKYLEDLAAIKTRLMGL
jgi:hypothetical protein